MAEADSGGRSDGPLHRPDTRAFRIRDGLHGILSTYLVGLKRGWIRVKE